jgi:hypothetical protein
VPLAALLIDNVPMPAGKKNAPPSLYQLKLVLLGISPPIWRRVQAPSTMPLSNVHDVLQAAMGWTNSHLHQFHKNGKYWGIPGDDEYADIKVIDERKVPVEKVLRFAGDTMRYLYDFGDDWLHEVVLEKILPSDVPTRPVCVAGERACPPEDVGGVHGYQEFLEVIFDPTHEEYDHYIKWAGKDFAPEKFDADAVNAKLGRMRWPVKHGR